MYPRYTTHITVGTVVMYSISFSIRSFGVIFTIRYSASGSHYPGFTLPFPKKLLSPSTLLSTQDIFHNITCFFICQDCFFPECILSVVCGLFRSNAFFLLSGRLFNPIAFFPLSADFLTRSHSFYCLADFLT